jgi:hypothetical protein
VSDPTIFAPALLPPTTILDGSTSRDDAFAIT